MSAAASQNTFATKYGESPTDVHLSIYKEIGPGKRISLMKLAIQKLEESARPLRIAIDIAIWQFQAQAARGKTRKTPVHSFYLCEHH